MSNLFSFWSRINPWKRAPHIDRYHVSAVTSPVELEIAEQLPIELRYVMTMRPSRHEAFRKMLEKGYGIGVRTVDRTPERVLKAVDRISHETQHNTIIPWLERLLRNEELPIFSEEELRQSEAKGINLYEEARIILAKRYEFKKIILIPLENQAVTEAERAFMQEVNEDLYPLAIDVIVNRVTFDNAHTRTEVAQSIVKALLVIGPVAHTLEHLVSGIGKVFAATADDLLSETAELFALRGSGFTWRQLAKRSRILIPVFILATYGAFQVEPLLHEGHLALAGVVFGLSAVALSLTTAIQSIFLYKHSYAMLEKEGKLRRDAGKGLFAYAFEQDFTNPARLGLFVGALSSPVVAATIFSFFPELTKNGWVLAMLGSTEAIVASLTVMAAGRLNRFRFRRRISRAIVERAR